MPKYYPVARHYITDDEVAAVTQALRNDYLTKGPWGKKFEQAFAEKIGIKYAVTVSSGTAGLHLTMLAANIGPGDKIITTPFSFIASANCILNVGAKPVFVDIDPRTFNMNPSLIEAKITPKTKAILVVHIFGQAVDMDPIMEIAERYKLKIIEDACESVTATYKGRCVGTFGESAVFAFFPNKQMTTGEGGMIVTNDQTKYELFSSLRNQGIRHNPQDPDYIRLGFNYRMNEMSAALGLSQFQKIDWLVAERRKIAGLYDKHLSSYQDLVDTPFTAETNKHSWFSYPIKIKNLKNNQMPVVDKLETAGIKTKPYFDSIHLFDLYKNSCGYRQGDFPISEGVSNSVLTLPFYIGLTEEDIKYISENLIETIKGYHEINPV